MYLDRLYFDDVHIPLRPYPDRHFRGFIAFLGDLTALMNPIRSDGTLLECSMYVLIAVSAACLIFRYC